MILKIAKRHIKHVRHHARKHHQNHLDLKKLLTLPIRREKILETFVATFALALLTIVLFMNWGRIVNVFVSDEIKPEEVITRGFQTGALGSYRILDQRNKEYELFLAQIPTSGYELGMQASSAVGKKEEEQVEITKKAFESSVFVTNDLSLGQHLTTLKKGQTKGLMKSVLSTFYLAEKTVAIDDVLTLDTRILSQINNALSVDVFQYLDQSANRSDQLKGYLNLLTTLQKEASKRANDLNAKIIFLKNNASAQEQQIRFSEEQFFNQLEAFNGPNAKQDLEAFIGLQTEQNEIKAKLGAYQGLLGYYEFFLPRLETMIIIINANWDALIAGVKVTEIQNMTLPLIIKP